MKRTLRWAQWMVVASAILLLFWIAASVGGWSPDVRRLTSSVHGPIVGDYRAESPQTFAPLSPAITKDASQDQASAGHPRPGASPSGGPTPGASGPSPTPTGSGILPTLPVPTPTVPVTPTLPVPTLPPTPTLPTPPPLP
jgi:hypothetical protein